MNNQRAFFRFVIPSIMAFALSGVYTIVDGFFIGNSLGDNGLAAINLAYPISAFIQAVGTGIGLSGAIRYTILRGQEQAEKETECFTSTVLLLSVVGFLLSVLILVFLSPLLHLFGATGEIYGLMKDYVQVIAIGALLQIFATGLVPFIRNLGGSSFAMVTMIAGFLTNIVLDYLFIGVYAYGMTGAALATIIGQGVTMIAAIGYLVKKQIGFVVPSGINLWHSFGMILRVAVAPFGLTFSPQITTILMNRFLMIYNGEQAVAVYGCIAYITAIIYLLLQGVGDGSQPLISRYYGEWQLDMLKQTRKLAYMTSGVIAFFCIIAVFLLRNDIGVLFGASAATNGNVAYYLPLFLATLLFLSYVRITTAYLYATEMTELSYLLVYAEPIITFLLLLLLPQIHVLGKLAVWIAVPAAQAMTWCISLVVKHYADKKTLITAS